ncbi:MAG: hypothetical protein P8179_25525, partial [Candidatus Thiodiazotropha sp.]
MQAVTLLKSGQGGKVNVEVISSKGVTQEARQAALAEEFVHLQQLANPVMRAKMLKLTEENLANWPQMSQAGRVDLIQTKLEVEADAQKILLKEGGPNVDRAMAQEHLTNIEEKLGELDKATQAGRVPEWVEHADAPRLFSKTLDQTLTVKSAAEWARAIAMYPHLFEEAEKVVVEQKVIEAATSAGDTAFTEATAQGMTPKQVRNAVNKAAKNAAKEVALDEALHSAKKTAKRAAHDGTAFNIERLDDLTKAQLRDYAAGTTGGNGRRLAGQLNEMREERFLETMADEVEAGRCTVRQVSINGPPPQMMDVYEYTDGTVVRYKPLGDTERHNPTYSIEVKKNPTLPDRGS